MASSDEWPGAGDASPAVSASRSVPVTRRNSVHKARVGMERRAATLFDRMLLKSAKRAETNTVKIDSPGESRPAQMGGTSFTFSDDGDMLNSPFMKATPAMLSAARGRRASAPLQLPLGSRGATQNSDFIDELRNRCLHSYGDVHAESCLTGADKESRERNDTTGKVHHWTDISSNLTYHSLAAPSHGEKIGELASTAICGNDITASCFYVVGELAKNAGIYSPFCTILSSFTLHCFRAIYGEVVTALPLNGGIYNLLLNSSSKQTASVAACLTILSYTATGVVSSVTAVDYLQCSPVFEGLAVVPAAIGILAFFAVLMLLGMQESSVVASSVFVFHLSVLFLLSVFTLLFIQDNGLDQFHDNMAWPHQPPPSKAIFFGFSSAMLGVSGFETSANFVEEQKPGVFPKTLRNMWISVSIINFVLPTLSLFVIPLDSLVGEESSFAVAFLASRVGGPLLRDLVAVDALLVLSGSVLTSYVGVVGLFQRMAGDRCLPELFATTNEWRGTPHWTILIFFGVCSSMCVLLDGNITLLAAIYSISFLLVMGLFAFCGLWMKVKRPTLPRQINTKPETFILGLLLVGTAFTAVVLLHPDVLTYFYIYYGITTLMVMTTFSRVALFTSFLNVITTSRWAQYIVKRVVSTEVASYWVRAQLNRLQLQGVVYFTKRASLGQINRALQYIEENEEARWVRVVHVHAIGEDVHPEVQWIKDYVQMLDCIYPRIRIDCIFVPGVFDPSIVSAVSRRTNIPTNCMFINCPRSMINKPLDTMGGVRVILNSEEGKLLDQLATPEMRRMRLNTTEKEDVSEEHEHLQHRYSFSVPDFS